MDDATNGKLLLVLLSFCWGLSWSAMRIALDEVSPWSMRLIGYCIGAATLLVLIKLQGRSLAHPVRPQLDARLRRRHVQRGGVRHVRHLRAAHAPNTSRVIIVNYSMPIWGSLMA